MWLRRIVYSTKSRARQVEVCFEEDPTHSHTIHVIYSRNSIISEIQPTHIHISEMRISKECLCRRRFALASFGLSLFLACADAWVHHNSLLSTRATPLSRQVAFADATASVAGVSIADDGSEDNAEEEEEYEYVEFDALTEAEFVGSEWLVGTNWDRSPEKIDETWVRLVVSEEGKNMCYWGDKSEGKWSLDVASQFLSISKESFFGKQIWAGVVDDYYFLQGTVRGWTYLQPASVLGQWQARRLGIDPEEAGTAPWSETDVDPKDKLQ